jgi:hypothetical protein
MSRCQGTFVRPLNSKIRDGIKPRIPGIGGVQEYEHLLTLRLLSDAQITPSTRDLAELRERLELIGYLTFEN